jgi:hypothetical protein
MFLEIAMVDVQPGTKAAFEEGVTKATPLPELTRN